MSFSMAESEWHYKRKKNVKCIHECFDRSWNCLNTSTGRRFNLYSSYYQGGRLLFTGIPLSINLYMKWISTGTCHFTHSVKGRTQKSYSNVLNWPQIMSACTESDIRRQCCTFPDNSWSSLRGVSLTRVLTFVRTLFNRPVSKKLLSKWNKGG